MEPGGAYWNPKGVESRKRAGKEEGRRMPAAQVVAVERKWVAGIGFEPVIPQSRDYVTGMGAPWAMTIILRS